MKNIPLYYTCFEPNEEGYSNQCQVKTYIDSDKESSMIFFFHKTYKDLNKKQEILNELGKKMKVCVDMFLQNVEEVKANPQDFINKVDKDLNIAMKKELVTLFAFDRVKTYGEEEVKRYLKQREEGYYIPNIKLELNEN